MGTSVPHPWKSHLARANSDAGYTNTRREGGVLLPGDGGAGRPSGISVSRPRPPNLSLHNINKVSVCTCFQIVLVRACANALTR